MFIDRSRLIRSSMTAVLCGGGLGLPAQVPDLQSLKQVLQGVQAQGQLGSAGADTPSAALPKADPGEGLRQEQRQRQRAALDDEIRALKAREKGPRRFAADLFDFRQISETSTEGGVSEDYVLGTGDQLQLNVCGSATFELPAQVDGKGEVFISKVGSVRVAGLSLAKAQSAVQSRIRQNFSNARVDLAVTKLREVRVFVLGEVYKPGSYLVPSLSSLVNVLGLAGGPTSAGSYRQIRVVRGGKIVRTVDLYPLRAEGFGNLNFGLQAGDTVFVPLAQNLVTLQGAFARTVAAAQAEASADEADARPGESKAERRLRREIERLEQALGSASDAAATQKDAGKLPSVGGGALATLARSGGATGILAGFGAGKVAAVPGGAEAEPSLAAELNPKERMDMEARLESLKDRLQEMKLKSRGDLRIKDPEAPVDELLGQPSWLTRWERDGSVPAMQFEMLAGETVSDALRFAGGFDVQAFAGRLTLRRLEASGAWNAVDVALEAGRPGPELLRGDVLTALPRRDRTERVVQVAGWVRGPGSFSRTEGLRVGDLLKREGQVLPDTYMARGEITRVLADGSTRYLAFDVAKAMAGEGAHNLILEDRDRVELYRIDDLRPRRTLTVVGPVQRPGTYEFHEGMRASDLLFRAGIPLRKADQFVAELSHEVDGKRSTVKRLELSRLLSNEHASPVDLRDDAANPLLEPFDQLSVYAQADYRPIRTITLFGQVKRPGVYTLESSQTTLKEVLERAGGLTADAMPSAAIFLRKMWEVDPDKAKAAEASGVEAADPTSNGITEILGRLNETMRNPLSGLLQKNPLLHGLQSGSLNRLVVDVPALIKGDPKVQLELQDGDEVIVPARTDAAYVVGETASPFAVYKVLPGTTVGDMLSLAGGLTRNADRGHIRLLKANGQILDSWVSHRRVEPGDTVLVPQQIRKDVSWQENLAALTPLAILINAVKK